MKRYEVIVERCDGCPLYTVRCGVNYKPWCQRENRQIDLVDIIAFPAWCPLPEVSKRRSVRRLRGSDDAND